MKITLIFAAIMATALSGCSKDETVSTNETTDKGVLFGVLNTKVPSRATETTSATIGAFSVYAYNYASGTPIDYTTEKPFYNGVTINVDPTGACTYADETKQKMWPSSDLLQFIGFAPTTAASYSRGVITFDMSNRETAARQIDLVVAKKSDQTKVGQPNNYKVPMSFSHALAQIRFKAIGKYPTVRFQVLSGKITGVDTKGTVDLTGWTPTPVNGASNTGNGLVWSLNGGVKSVIFGASGVPEFFDNVTPVDLTHPNGALLMIIPQTLKGGTAIGEGGVTVDDILSATDKSYIVITYRAIDKDTGAILVSNGRCAVPVSTTLKPGLRYVYTLLLAGTGDGSPNEEKLYPIDFTCTVDGWEENNMGEIQI